MCDHSLTRVEKEVNIARVEALKLADKILVDL